MVDSVGEKAVRSGYEVFRAELKREPSAAEALAWAREHAGEPGEGWALVDAGWFTWSEGRYEEALELFRQGVELGGEDGRHAQVGIVDTLYGLGRKEEGEQASRALRAELEQRPGGLADLKVISDLVEVFGDLERHEVAVDWCELGLARAAEFGESEEALEYRHSLEISRAFHREDAGMELDEADRGVIAQADAELADFRAALGPVRDHLMGNAPMDGEAFDGVVLRWRREDFPQLRSRWPAETALYGDEYDGYARLIEREARGISQAGAHRIHLVTGELAEYEAFAEREGRDPAEPSTRKEYGQWAYRERPATVPLWPPDRNSPCWCDSARKYKKCCGAPANR